ncbi:putative prostacyclin synthase-like [Scophthalmus maximus]|uniref:Prostacyclin synthase n=1 Tax=Scophthalmus maximus TaxID=52904 RepID=A0A2U9BFF5_SCOMX|nr:prostacyclin synthase [Scophthalmus maximus]AWP02694.1 putative prostacyclin synthase-like [Scophthalmus maximus]
MLWTLVLLLIGLFIIVLLYSTRTRQKNEPPLDKGSIPWLGHALEFGKDAAKFLARMKEKHGDIFTVCVAGHYVTVLLDPKSFDAVINDTEFLDFTRNRNQLLKRIFSLQLPSVKPAAERTWMKRHFQGHGLSKLSSSMNIHLQSLLLSDHRDCGPSKWRQEGLFSLCYSLLFRAGYLTLFESTDNAAAVYKEFRKFDNLLTKVARSSLNRGESKTANSSRERLWELLSQGRLSGRSETGSWQQSYHHFLQEQGVDAEMQTRALLLQLWTTQCNAGPAAFWLLGFLLTHPEAMEAVRSEVGHLISQDTHRQHPPTDLLEAHSTPVLDSVLSETLRLTAAVMISREVVQDKTLHMANGQEYHLRQGDRVCLFPFLSPQMDPEIHQDPQLFKYDRFLNEDITVKDKFYKDEKILKYYTLPWGAGGNICSGKDFAVQTVKQFVFLLLTHLDIETCDPDDKLPPVNPSRYGFGMLQPDGDLQVRYRLKEPLYEI